MTINYKGDAIRAISTLGLGGVDITEWPVSETEVAAIKSNIGYNTALSAGLFALGHLNLNDGVVNPFSAETEVDLVASSNQVYDAANDLYKNALSAATQSWNKVANGETASSTNFSFRSILSGSEISTSGAYCRVTLTARATGDGMKLDNVSIGERSGSTASTVAAPVEFLFGGNSGTGIVPTGSSTTSDWLAFTIDETKDYVVIMDVGSDTANDSLALTDEVGAVFYHRSNFDGFNVISGAGYTLGSDQIVGVTKLEVTDADADVTLQSTAITASAVPTEAHVSFLLTPITAVIPDIDIKGYVSRDGGTTWAQATLQSQSIGFPWQVMMSGGVDLSSQPSGSSMKWRLISANNKQFQFENVSLFWN